MMLIADDSFKSIAAYAKAVALGSGRNTLSTLLMLQGAQLASQAGTLPKDCVDTLVPHQEAITTLARAEGLFENVNAPVTDRALPMDDSLKAILGQHMESSTPAFLMALLASLSLVTGKVTAVEAGEPIHLAEVAQAEVPQPSPANVLLQSNAFLAIKGYAKALAMRYGLVTLTPALAAAAAWAALRAGDLEGQFTLSTHLEAHADDIKRLLKGQGWELANDLAAPDDEAFRLELDPDIKAVLSAMASENSPVLEFVRWCVHTAGTRLRLLEHVAYHEAAHAVVSMVLRPNYRVSEVTIVARGNSAGQASFSAANMPTTWESIWEDLCVTLAGRYAEIRQFGQDAMNDGASTDLADATKQAWRAIAELGMDSELGPVRLDVLKATSGMNSGWLFDLAQQRLHAVMRDTGAKTEKLVEAHWEQIQRLAQLLLDKQTVSEEEIRAVLKFQG